MPKVSRKAIDMPASPIRKLVPFAEAAREKGKKIYYLNIGQPDIETPANMLNAVKNMNEKVIAYSHSAGHESYRRKLVSYYADNNIKVDHTQILITTGGSEALEVALMSCLNPGDEIIIPEPFYANYNGFSCQAGVKVVPVTANISSGFALPPVADFEKLINEKTKAILICNPSNPTGYLYTDEELKQLKDIVLRHDLFLIADEVYREFCYDGRTHTSVLSLGGLDQHAVLIDSISKRYSACGARIGALISRNAELMQVGLKFGQARLSPPSLGQILGEAGLDTPQSYFDEVIGEYVKRRDFLVDELNSMDGVYCPKPSGAFYCTVQLPVDDSDKFCQWILESFEHDNQTVMMAPASGFYSDPKLGKQQVRIAYVLNREDLKSAMDCLKEALEQYPGRDLSKSVNAELAG
ncbi:MAG: pyridoxal phosphate-dependent aminotransferase [Bacteroidia bacterium]|nr:pyridoxal phosphate-dependent aminotransferase [Bacteroidia bacterium]